MEAPRARIGPSRLAGPIVVVACAVLFLMGVPRRGMTEEEAAAERATYVIWSEAEELRAALEEYRRDHGEWPGFPPAGMGGGVRAAREDWLVRQLTMASDESGRISPQSEPAFPFGPYLPGGMPVNPANGLASIQVLGLRDPEPEEADGRTGWIYDPASGDVWVNAPGRVGETGARHFDI